MAQIISRIWKPFSGGSVTDAGVSVAILRTKIRLEMGERDLQAREVTSTLDAAVDGVISRTYPQA